MTCFLAMETQSFLDATFSLFWGELSHADDIDVHCIRILGFRDEGLILMLGGTLVSFRNFLSSFPLSLEVDRFGVPFLDGSWYGVHGHDSLHEDRGYSGRKVSNKDVWVSDIGLGDMVLEFGDVLVQRGRIGSVLFEGHLLGGEPSNGGTSDIPLFEVLVELEDEI